MGTYIKTAPTTYESKEAMERARHRYAHNLYALCTEVLGYEDLDWRVHGQELCKFVESDKHKKATAPATSSGLPALLSGIFSMNSCIASPGPNPNTRPYSRSICSHIGVGITPGHTALTLILYAFKASAADCVTLIMAALLAA